MNVTHRNTEILRGTLMIPWCYNLFIDKMNVTHRNTEILTGTLMCRIGSVSPTERSTVPTVTNSRMDSGSSMDVCMLGQVPYDSMTIKYPSFCTSHSPVILGDTKSKILRSAPFTPLYSLSVAELHPCFKSLEQSLSLDWWWQKDLSVPKPAFLRTHVTIPCSGKPWEGQGPRQKMKHFPRVVPSYP